MDRQLAPVTLPPHPKFRAWFTPAAAGLWRHMEERIDNMERQLSFDGREVTQIQSKFGELELDSLPEGLTREDLAGLVVGDEVMSIVRWRLESKNHSEKTDRQGFGTKPFTRKLIWRQLAVDFLITEQDKQGFERKSRHTITESA